MSCVAFVLLKMMLLSHFWAIEENRKVFALLMSHWILRSPFSHRCFSQACTEGGSMAWLAIFAIQNDYFIFPFWVCQGEQNSCCQHLRPGIRGGIFFFFHLPEDAHRRTEWRKPSGPNSVCVFFSLLFMFSLFITYFPEHVVDIKMLLGHLR